MTRRLPTLAWLVLALATATLVSARDKRPELVNDMQKRAAIKRLAVLSVYGPEQMTVGFSHFKEQELYDAMEAELLRRLEQAGFAVVPPAETKALLAQEFFAAYTPNMTKDMKRYADKMRPVIDAGYFIHCQQSPMPSKNTRVLFGTDQSYIELGYKKNAHENGTDESDYHQPWAAYDEPLMKTLQALAPKLGGDGFVMFRVLPDIPATVAKKASKWNPFGAITEGVNAVRAIKEGDHGFVTLDLVLYDNAGEVVFQDQVVRMSQEATGRGGGFNFTMDDDPANKLIALASDRALQKLFEDFGGRPPADDKAVPPATPPAAQGAAASAP